MQATIWWILHSTVSQTMNSASDLDLYIGIFINSLQHKNIVFYRAIKDPVWKRGQNMAIISGNLLDHLSQTATVHSKQGSELSIYVYQQFFRKPCQQPTDTTGENC